MGQGGKGADGVTAAVQAIDAAIGYVEQNMADKNRVPYGLVKNKAGKFLKASRRKTSPPPAAAPRR